jgi:hypothetical protein
MGLQTLSLCKTCLHTYFPSFQIKMSVFLNWKGNFALVFSRCTWLLMDGSQGRNPCLLHPFASLDDGGTLLIPAGQAPPLVPAGNAASAVPAVKSNTLNLEELINKWISCLEPRSNPPPPPRLGVAIDPADSQWSSPSRLPGARGCRPSRHRFDLAEKIRRGAEGVVGWGEEGNLPWSESAMELMEGCEWLCCGRSNAGGAPVRLPEPFQLPVALPKWPQGLRLPFSHLSFPCFGSLCVMNWWLWINAACWAGCCSVVELLMIGLVVAYDCLTAVAWNPLVHKFC